MLKRPSLLVLCAVLLACPVESPRVSRQSVVRSPQPRLEIGTEAYYNDPTAAADAVQKLRERVGEPFRVLTIDISERGVRVKAQDPKNRENVDEYRFHNGTIDDPVPVRLFGGSDQKTLEANLFNPADVDLAQVPALVKEAREKIHIEGGELTGVTIRRHLPFERAVQIDVDFHGTRKSAYLRADRHGKRTEVNIF